MSGISAGLLAGRGVVPEGLLSGRPEARPTSLIGLAVTDPDAFVDLVKKLRAAGVVKLGALVLGPEPRDPAVHEPVDPLTEAQRKHRVMFAASRIAPPFVPPQGSENGTPRAIVQRRERDGAANGEGRTTR